MKPSVRVVLLVLIALSTQVRGQVGPCDSFTVAHNPRLPLIYSPDSSMYLVNVQDTADIFQIYVGNAGDTATTCISLTGPWGAFRPWSVRNKLMVQWHSSGDFIICGVEKEFYPELLYVPYPLRLGWLQSGIWLDIWAVTPDGSTWSNLAYTESGFTGPAFTPDGTLAAWAEAKDSSNLAVDVFGVWRMRLSNFAVNGGIPSFASTTDITPAGARWIEPGNFHPDGRSLLISSDIGMTNAEGQDQYILDIYNGSVINLTNSPKIWDEHGIFSPDGSKILFMTSYPYRADTNSYHTTSIKAEFMLMNPDGSGLQQLTHFRDSGYVESHEGIAATGFWGKGDSTIYAQSLIFPDYENWLIKFNGDCGYLITSTEEAEVTPDAMTLFPNPTEGNLTLETSFDLRRASVTIFNSLGQVVQHRDGMYGRQVRIETDGLEKGLYFLRLDTGKQHASKTFLLR